MNTTSNFTQTPLIKFASFVNLALKCRACYLSRDLAAAGMQQVHLVSEWEEGEGVEPEHESRRNKLHA